MVEFLYNLLKIMSWSKTHPHNDVMSMYLCIYLEYIYIYIFINAHDTIILIEIIIMYHNQ